MIVMVDKAYVKMWTLRKETQNHTHTHTQTHKQAMLSHTVK